MADMEKLLSSGELARQAGINVETLRYYERVGLLRRPARTASGHRRYDVEVLAFLRIVKLAQELGFTLAEIRQLDRELERSSAVCGDVCQAIDAKIGHVDQELEKLRSLRERLTRLRSTCPGRRTLRECPVVIELKAPVKNRRRSP
jgi:MerR family copper efflux transcriptional regulator